MLLKLYRRYKVLLGNYIEHDKQLCQHYEPELEDYRDRLLVSRFLALKSKPLFKIKFETLTYEVDLDYKPVRIQNSL